jgi:hypothetical protein
MNRIKIIKRADLHSALEARETEAEKVNPAVLKRQAVKVVADWVDEWRKQKPKDPRRAFADLFGSTYIAVNR